MSLNRITAIVFKEFIHIKRDKPTLGIIFAFPIVMLMLFGYAVSTDVDHMSTVVYNQDNQAESRDLIQKFEQSTYFKISGYVNSEKEMRRRMDLGKAKLGLIFPPDYTENLHKGHQAQVELVLDGSDPTTARTALFSAKVIAMNKANIITAEALTAKGLQINSKPLLDLRTRVWYNPDMKSELFNIPGLVGLILQNITILLTAFALVRERDRGTMEQLIVTPIRPLELMLGKLIPYIIVASIDVTLSLLVATLWFKVHIAGSIFQLIILSGIFLVGALGVGLLISTVARNQLQAMQLAMAFILPSVLLSGFMFPREAMPFVIYVTGYFIPLTYFLEILRGVILKGIGISALWQNTILLAFFGIGILVLSATRFKKKLD